MKKRYLYSLSWSLPVLMLVLYFMMMGITPFGDHTFLNYDVYHQYLNNFMYMKHAIVKDPSSIIYSFTSSFGNEMLGTWTYYLGSPFNVLVFLFKNNNLATAFNLILVLKIATSSLTMSWYLKRQFKSLASVWILVLSLSYAFNGWIITYYLDLLWLDAMIWLPIMVWGIHQIFEHKQMRWYLLSFTAMLIINYYMAAMMGIFSIFLMVHYLVLNPQSFDDATDKVFVWIKSNVLSVLLSAFSLLPTAYSLFNGKLEYSMSKFNWDLEYNPFLLPGQFMTGVFVKGDYVLSLPHLFMGSVAVILALTFFFNGKIARKTKIINGVMTAFFLISLMWRPLDLLWHGGQMPTWYSYRWSFLFTFWLLYLAAMSLTAGIEWTQKLKIRVLGVIALGWVDILIMLPSYQHHNLDWVKFSVSTILLLIGIFLLWSFKKRYMRHFLVVFTMLDLFINLTWTLNGLEHPSLKTYQNDLNQVTQLDQTIQPQQNEFYRSNKMFGQDFNDPLVGNYYSGDAFTSALLANSSQISKQFGQAYTYGISKYENATVVGDSLLGFRYFVTNDKIAQNSNFEKSIAIASFDRNDLNDYQVNHYDPRTGNRVLENPFALSLGFGANQQIDHKIKTNDPIQFEDQLVQAIQGYDRAIFKTTPFKMKRTIDTLTVKFKTHSTNPYYLMVPYAYQNYETLTINGRYYHRQEGLASTNPQIISVTDGKKDQDVTVKFKIYHKSKFRTQPAMKLYQLRRPAYQKAFHQMQSHQLQIKTFQNNRITGDIVIGNEQSRLLTTIPYDTNWLLYANGKLMPTKNYHHFLGAKLSPGHYQIKLIYVNKTLVIGVLVTSLTILVWLLIFIIQQLIKRFRQK